MPQTLPQSNYVSVAVNLTPSGAQAQSLNTLLILDDTNVIDPSERIRSYSTLAAVASDFGTSGNIYLSAAAYFAQSPQPSQVYVGRWVKAASAGGLRCATLSAAQQAIATWNTVTAGSFRVAVNGGAPTNIAGMNFSAAANLSAVAAIIQAAMTGVNVTWNAVFSRFEFISTTTGATSAVSFLSATGTGTDISPMLMGLSTSSGAYIYAGMAAETAATAVALFDTNYGQQWYALVMPSIIAGVSTSDHLAVAAYIEGSANKHIYGVNTQEGGCLVASDTTNVGYQLKQLGYKKTMVQYSSSSLYAISSLLGRSITTNFAGNNTVIDLMYKNEPGVAAENLNTTQANALNGFNVNAFVAINNGTNIIQYGNMASGDPIDVITGTDWLAIAIQNALFNLLYTSATKVPQTEAGSNLLVNTVESVCSQAVTNGLLGAGVWTNSGFGLLNQNDFLPKGFYVYIAPLNTQSVADRAARKAPPIQVAAKLSGAFRSISVSVLVNR